MYECMFPDSTPEGKCENVLLIAELVARGCPWRSVEKLLTDKNGDYTTTKEELAASFESFTSTIKYLSTQAKADWKEGFDHVLNTSHSMRVLRISAERKKSLRGGKQVCMACGREEKNCEYTVDFAGCCDMEGFINDAPSVQPAYKAFINDYEMVYAPKVSPTQLPKNDRGTYVLGETCLRKAKLAFLTRVTILEKCYAAEHEIGMTMGGPKLGCTFDEETVMSFVKQMEDLKLAIADDKRLPPPIPIDQIFWDRVDTCRDLVSKNKDDVLDQLLYKRAFREMANKSNRPAKCAPAKGKPRRKVADAMSRYYDECSEFSEMENSSSEEALTSQSEEGEEDSEDSDRPRAEDRSTSDCRRVSKRTRAGSFRKISTSEDDEPDNSNKECEKEDKSEEQPRENGKNHAAVLRSTRDAHDEVRMAQTVAARQRASGNLRSREVTLVALMDLQVRLARKKEFGDASVCSDAILTLQELISRVETLQHTAGI